MIDEKCHLSLTGAEESSAADAKDPTDKEDPSGLSSCSIDVPVPEPFLLSLYVNCNRQYACKKSKYICVLYCLFILGNIRVCYTHTLVVVLRVLQHMLVVPKILLYCKVTLGIFYK